MPSLFGCLPQRSLLHGLTFVCTVGMVMFPLAASASSGFTGVSQPSNGRDLSIDGFSSDGAIYVGTALDTTTAREFAYIWTQSGGYQRLGSMNGGTSSLGLDISNDGSVVGGAAEDGANSNALTAFRWTQATGMQSLGLLNGGSESAVTALSADGSIVVGDATDGADGDTLRGFRWTQATGLQSLGLLNGGTESQANNISADGTVIVGTAKDGSNVNTLTAFRWTQGSGMESLGLLNGGTRSIAVDVSADGGVIVGNARDGAASNQRRAFRWTQATGMQSLGLLNGGTFSDAYAVSDDGTVIVGEAWDGSDGDTQRGFRWTQATGMQTVEDWLRDNGVTISTNNTLNATSMSGDGNVVSGMYDNGVTSTAYIARVSSSGSGLITLADVQDSLSEAARSGRVTLTTAGTMINGAHSRPLARRVAPSKSVSWVAGDWGQDDHNERSGDLGLGEAGIGHNFGSAQVNLSIGHSWANQDLALNGKSELDGNYILAETLIPMGHHLWATFGAHYNWGEADMKRGYRNAGTPDTSTGKPGTDGWGLRARVDWDKAYQVAQADFSPYLDLTRTESTLAAYTETGGGFPARFNERSDRATELRLGVNAAKPIIDNVRLIVNAEGAHRFEERGARTAGEVIGVSAFNLESWKNQQDWLRGGVGAEADIATGTASLSFNATTHGEMPTYWLAFSWQKAF